MQTGYSFTVFVLCLLEVITDASTINLAKNQRCKYFDKTVTEWFDGNTNYNESRPYESIPDRPNIQFSIIIKKPCTVNFVIIYAGATTTPDQLSYLAINFIEKPTGYSRCSEVPSIVLPGDVVRVNCKSTIKLQDEIEITTRHNTGIDIAEIEIHTFATEYPKLKFALLYHGCFEEFGEDPLRRTLAQCHEYCVRNAHVYMGMKGKDCSCGDILDYESQIPIESCNLPCPGFPHRFCGSEGANYSVYLIRPAIPYFLGCFRYQVENDEEDDGDYNKEEYDDDYKDEDDHDERAPTHNITIIECIIQCETYKFAMLEEGKNCHCYNYELDKDDILDVETCNSTCEGDQGAFCGSEGKVSVYSTCNIGTKRLTCSKIFRCQGKLSFLGECDVCERGYVGMYCMDFADFTPTLPPIIPNTTMTVDLPGIDWRILAIIFLTIVFLVASFAIIRRVSKK